MLLTVCALLPALAVVSSQKVVTQKPPVITVDKGNSVTMDCNIAKDESYYVSWYKQIPPAAPEFVLRFYHSHSAPDKYGDNFSSTRFTSKASSSIDYQLIISNVEVGDSAVYYCNTWDNSASVVVPHTSLQSLLYLLLTLLISSLSTRVPSHTDTMLPALCSLFTALSCVSGVTVVTQKPPVLTLTQGQTATMDCNLGTASNGVAYWYKQVPGGVPQYVLKNYHSWSAPNYGSGFSSSKFKSTCSSSSDCNVVINNVEVGDSAVYYCKTWDSSASEYVFGQGSKLIVSDAALPAPVLTVLPPSSKQLESKKATLVCLASEVAGGFADVRWLVNGNSVTSGVITGSALQQTNKKFTLSSYLTVDSSEWENNKDITCEVSAGGKAASVKINKSECSE
ncbi:immunoglobulin lambda-1 light chain-like [Clarias gariepinus]|uniref:immunoglobulin lambda-1 light chain-like n=1 Tax=Clarias gariepinus TaxID=13013 RepID=UPI00234E070C|nr:immunoglobulin lambda-1 light chain-like [Clarias gariepinus]